LVSGRFAVVEIDVERHAGQVVGAPAGSAPPRGAELLLEP
jgi:hypothetical protein